MRDVIEKIKGKMTYMEFINVVKRFKCYTILNDLEFPITMKEQREEKYIKFSLTYLGKRFYFINDLLEVYNADPSETTSNLRFEAMQGMINDRILYQKFIEYLTIEGVMCGYITEDDLERKERGL
ncbi:hypothetical protein [Bacillus pumilus]|uniref:hypothetical protein n=1 Tax=Bacillus pumilus TaxID=1408 RepID=UPI0011A309D3|nr:hypothetical protein [Bacillus pumilus]